MVSRAISSQGLSYHLLECSWNSGNMCQEWKQKDREIFDSVL